ncbi:MAG: TonB-dependent receptor [Paracoccus denitrificans]|uniref:TonB-dependent receptor n=1 Tax=Paracoccus denitrificans TaxID=266 RepID=A0A533HZY0_PARDE|nr:MAG: TonB-dependent receptor [Paracoccus denitrificans]
MMHMSAMTKLRSRTARVVLRTLMASAALSYGVGFSAAKAQTAQQVSLSIPAGPLDSALTQFGEATGLQLVYDSGVTSGQSTAGVSGAVSRDAALSQLLSGTGLSYSFTGPNSVTIIAPAAASSAAAPETAALQDGTIVLDTVVLRAGSGNSTLGAPAPAYAGGQVATGGQLGMLGERDIMDTPFSQTNYTRETIANQQARTVNEVLSIDPSIIVNNSGNRSDAETIRGFQTVTSNGTRSLNGLPGLAPIEFPSADFLERVEVLKGPSALLNGMSAKGGGTVGGAVNLTSKQATDEPLTRITSRYASDSVTGGHVDISRRYGANKEFGLRFNGSFDAGDSSVDGQWVRSGLGALALDYRGDRFRVAADLAYQRQEESPRANYVILRSVITTLPDVPDAPDVDTRLFPTWEEGRSETKLGMIRGEFDITDNVTAYAAFGSQRFERRFSVAGPATLQGEDGSYTIQPWVQKTDYDVDAVQAGLRATVNTGAVEHSLGFNLSRNDYEERSAYWIGERTDAGTLDDPFYPARPELGDPGDTRISNESTISSAAFADTMSFQDGRILVTAGLRYQKVETKNYSSSTGELTTSYDSDKWSPSIGVVYKPRENISVYANYIEGLEPGTTVSEYYANAGEVFEPYASEQYEIGAKFDWGRFTTTIAAFQITQPSAISIPDEDGGLPRLALNGEQRNRGVEISGFGELTDDLRLLGGVTLLDAKQKNTADGIYDGERAASAPKFRAVLGAEWDTPFADGLTLTGRITHTSDQVVVNNRPDLKIPSWTQVDLGARYEFETAGLDNPATLRLNVDNVFNESYWKAPFSSGMLHLSEPRTFRASLSYDF